LWFEFLEISSDRGKSIFLNFWKRGQRREAYPNFCKFFTRDFRSIWFSSRNFCSCQLNGLLFRNSTISRLFWNFPWKFPYHLSPFWTFLYFLDKWNVPQGSTQILILLALWYQCVRILLSSQVSILWTLGVDLKCYIHYLPA